MQEAYILHFVADEEYGDVLEGNDGFLVSPEHAMYVEREYGTLYIVKVKEVDNGNYTSVSGHVELGTVQESEDDRQVIERVLGFMKGISFFEYITDIHDFSDPMEFNFTGEE
jgi:hypothetical protein